MNQQLTTADDTKEKKTKKRKTKQPKQDIAQDTGPLRVSFERFTDKRTHEQKWSMLSRQPRKKQLQDAGTIMQRNASDLELNGDYLLERVSKNGTNTVTAVVEHVATKTQYTIDARSLFHLLQPILAASSTPIVFRNVQGGRVIPFGASSAGLVLDEDRAHPAPPLEEKKQ